MAWKMCNHWMFIFITLSTTNCCFVCAWPQCAEYRFDKNDMDLNSEDIQLRGRIPKLFESYDYGNYTGVERTLYSLQSLRSMALTLQQQQQQREESSTLKTVEQIENDGYPSSVHHVKTDDGYILELHRIGNNTSNETKLPIFLMHGLLESSNGWIALGPNHSLAYLLYNNGYDVWLGNARGTKSSQSHVYLSSSGRRRRQYWSFSLHEIGIYDLPSCINHILHETNQTRLNYIGFSQGTTVFFIMSSTLPEYNEKIASMIALAPIVFMKNSKNNLLNTFVEYNTLIRRILNYMKFYSVDPGNKALRWIAEYACRNIDNMSSPVPCQFILFCLDSNQINCTSLPRIVEHIPNSASLQQLYHFAQLKRTGKFQQYDYLDGALNKKRYGMEQPPSYQLDKVNVPISIIYSKGDESANYTDVEYLSKVLPNVREIYRIPSDDFKHVDFIYSRFVRKLVNEKIIDLLKR